MKGTLQPGVGDSFLLESHSISQPVEPKIIEEGTFFRGQERRVACVAAINGFLAPKAAVGVEGAVARASLIRRRTKLCRFAGWLTNARRHWRKEYGMDARDSDFRGEDLERGMADDVARDSNSLNLCQLAGSNLGSSFVNRRGPPSAPATGISNRTSLPVNWRAATTA